MDPAPYLSELAEGPAGGHTVWLVTADGTRIRAASWPGGSRGTVFMFPGRCEYIEKYGRAAASMVDRGYGVVSVDWRGQGLSDRLLENPDIGHVRFFMDYQADVRALVTHAMEQSLPKPWFLLAHSMGGAIGLRSLIEGQPFAAAAFSAPMWGIVVTPRLRHLARVLPSMARRIGMGARQAPTTGGPDVLLQTPFEENVLTTDRNNWDYMSRQMQAHPRFRLGGPSLTWLAEALLETRALQHAPLPSLPAHASVGSREKIVDPDVIARVMEKWPGGSFAHVPNAEHELLMEQSAIRTTFLDRCEAVFDEAVALL